MGHCVHDYGYKNRGFVLLLAFKGGGPRVVVSTAAFHARVRGSVPGLGGLKETKLFLPHPRVKVSIVGSLRDREVACSASDRQGSNFESCVWRTVSSQSSHHPQEVLLAQFSLYVHKGGLKPDSFHFISFSGIQVSKKQSVSSSLTCNLWETSVTKRPCSASDHRRSNFESCVWRTVSSHSSHHPQEVLLAQFSM